MKVWPILFAAGVAAAQTILTPAQTQQIRNLANLRFSPDSKLLAIETREPVKGTSANSHVWVLRLAAGEVRRWTASPKSESSPQWSGDGRFLAFLSDRDERRQIYLMRSDSGEAERLTETKNSVQSFQWSPDGREIAFLAGEPKSEEQEKRERDKADMRVADRDESPNRVWVVDVESRKVRQVVKSPWRVQELAWEPGNRSLIVKATEHPESDRWTDAVYRLSLEDGKLTQMAAPRGPFREIKLSADGKQFAYVGSPGDGPTAHDLFVHPAVDGKPENLTGKRLDRPVSQYEWRPDGSLTAIVQKGFHHELESIRDSGLEPMFSDFKLNPSDFAMSRSGALAMVAASSTTMPEVWLADPGTAPRPVTHFNEAWSKIPLQPVEFVKYPSFDGVAIEAQLVKPPGYGSGAKLPLIVLIHGGPTGAWTDRFNAWAQLLASRGFVVLCPNIRGSIGYGHKFIESNRADWGGGDFQDAMAGADWLIARGGADAERLGIGGWSYGGYMAMWAITQTNRFKAAVAGAGMSDLASEFGTEQFSGGDEWFYGTPYERLAGFQKSSPITFIKNARTPTLLLQGEADKTDPIGQSQQFYRALKRYGVNSDFVLYPREGHGITEEKHAQDVLERMLAWFETYVR